MDINSLKSTCYKEYNFLYIPPNPNKTSIIANCSNITYSSNTKSTLENIKN